MQSRTVARPGEADAAVLAFTASDLGVPSSLARDSDAVAREPVPALAVSIDCNGRRVAADPYWGTVEAVLECAANLACVGAHALGATDNLNFGNPTKPHIAWQLTESVRGLGDACRALGVPIVGGNVSLYNEGPAGPIYPTPVVGMVGHLPDARRAARIGFSQAREAVALVGGFAPRLGASELHKLLGEPLPERLAAVDLDAARATQSAVREAVRSGSLASAHDIAEGGLAVALAECCLGGALGASIALPAGHASGEHAVEDERGGLAELFGEAAGGFVVSGDERSLLALGERVPVLHLGSVGGESLTIDRRGERLIDLPLARLREAHDALRELFP